MGMELFLDNEPCKMPLRPEATLAEVLDSVWVELPPGRIVTAIHIDGIEHHPAERERFARRAVSSVENVAVFTQSPEAFVAQKRTEVGRALCLIAEKARHAAMLFRRGDASGGNALFGALMEELRLVLMLERELVLLAKEDRSSGLSVSDLEPVARDLLAAQEKKAWEAVAAVLTEGLVPLLQGWAALRGSPERKPVEPGVR